MIDYVVFLAVRINVELDRYALTVSVVIRPVTLLAMQLTFALTEFVYEAVTVVLTPAIFVWRTVRTLKIWCVVWAVCRRPPIEIGVMPSVAELRM